MQVVFSVNLSLFYCVLGNFSMYTNTMVQNFLLVFWFLRLFHWH